MGRQVGSVPIGCTASANGHRLRTIGYRQDGRLLVWRCKDRNCAEAAYAKQTNQIAVHVYDWETGVQWTNYEPDGRREQE